MRLPARYKLSLSIITICLVITTALASAQPVKSTGFVYVATNEPSGNRIIQYSRASSGLLTEVTEAATGGAGATGNGVGPLDPLGSQDSLVLSPTGSVLLAVNAGSNQLSSLSAGRSGLHLLSTVSSAGTFPNSVALNGDLVYVLNAQGTPNITGFRLNSSGQLEELAGSTRNLPGGTSSAPHDIRFSSDGTRLLVSEGGTNQIDIFELGNSGLVVGTMTQASAGSGPFGMRFGRSGVLVTAEAGTNSVSSYFLTSQDTLSVISASVPDGQQATCWITLTGNGSFGFVSNTASGTLSSYHLAKNGTLNLESAVAGSLGSGAPIDSALSNDSEFFYVDDSALGRIVIFAVKGASLIPIGSVTGLPTTLQGIAAQ
jgi:3-carboxymuconate cyclase